MSEPESAAERINMACFQLSREIDGLACSVEDASPLARTLLRVVGRVVIDTGVPGADPAVWENTEVMALQWVREAVNRLGYDVTPLPDSGRPAIPNPSSDWT